MMRNIKNMKNDKCTLQDLEYAKITENVDHEKKTFRTELLCGKLKKVENEKCPLQDMEYAKKTENHGK